MSSNNGKLNGDKKIQSIEETKNWENSMTGDGDRFSQAHQSNNGNKNIKSFDIYLKRKAERAAAKKAAKQKSVNKNETSSIYTNFHGQTRS